MLCDFGAVKVVDEVSASDKFTATVNIGSLQYMAPEVAIGVQRGGKAKYSSKCDLWSLGALTLVLMTRRLVSELFYQYGAEEFREHLSGTAASAELLDLMEKIFVPDEDRITIEEIKQHPWYNMPVPSDHEFACELFRRNPGAFRDSVNNVAPRTRLAADGSSFYAAAVGCLVRRERLTGTCSSSGI